MPRPGNDRWPDAGSLLVLDAGGTSTRARLTSEGAVLFEGVGGPGNPRTACEETLRASYGAALRDSPAAETIAAYVAGASAQEIRRAMRNLLSDLMPLARVVVFPDYVATYCAAPAGTNVCVVAGTGSLVCSETRSGFAVTGGHGWMLGDQGSGFRLGRAALEWFLDHQHEASDQFLRGIQAVFGSLRQDAVLATLYKSTPSVRLVASVAPLLTAEAERGLAWAAGVMEREMMSLAAIVADHISVNVLDAVPVCIALAGGVWSTSVTVDSFTQCLHRYRSRGDQIDVSKGDALDGGLWHAMRMIL